jgi:hypothetical protein
MWSFIKICLICIIGINRLKEKFHRKTWNIWSSLTYILGFSVRFFSASLFRLGILWDKNHIKIFCSEIWVKMIFGWPTFKIMCNTPIFYGFRGEDLTVIFYQNMSNLHNRHKSAERKISQKNMEYMLNYSLPCSCS